VNQLLKTVISQIKPDENETKKIKGLARELLEKTNNLDLIQ
jgi:tRNA nucleotidyltransferase (CCA-adding enzyme)